MLNLAQPYGEARSVLRAYVPHVTLPETLKGAPTDTDRKNAIEQLVDAVDDHAGQAWADEILAGPVGTQASQVIQELNEAIHADSALSIAQTERAKAHGLAYERYLAFKHVVRSAYGPKSPQYRSIHLRADGTTDDDASANGTPTT